MLDHKLLYKRAINEEASPKKKAYHTLNLVLTMKFTDSLIQLKSINLLPYIINMIQNTPILYLNIIIKNT